MRSDFLPFSPPLIGGEEITEVVDSLRSDWTTTGPREQGSGGAEERGSVHLCTSAQEWWPFCLIHQFLGPFQKKGLQFGQRVESAWA